MHKLIPGGKFSLKMIPNAFSTLEAFQTMVFKPKSGIFGAIGNILPTSDLALFLLTKMH